MYIVEMKSFVYNTVFTEENTIQIPRRAFMVAI